ncbi:MAG: cytochrome c biogenesis protein CcdA [Dehalobacterium sp.]
METFLNETIPYMLRDVSPVTFIAIFTAGLLTSISPCILSIIPVMVGYIGGYGRLSKVKGFFLSLSFVLGMSLTFALLGMAAVAFGTIFGKVGAIWYLIIGGISILMGLNLWQVWQMRLPGLKIVPPRIGGFLGAFLVGLFFGIVASPCATPVLVAILAMVTSTANVSLGGFLLFAYGLGHGVPLLLTGTFTGFVKGIKIFQKNAQYINYISGTLLVMIGLYFIYLAT